MANTVHASLTGSDLHEPKGITSADTGTVYVSNGGGSGSWQNIGTSSFTGMIGDFLAPIAPIGWLELDGSSISTSTYSNLYSVMSLQSSGTRSNLSPIITSIPDTSKFRVGYYVFGNGVTSGTTILTIDSASQITLSANAISTGTSTFAVSPWLLNNGTIQLPDVTTAGRYRRSRTSAVPVGTLLSDQNQAHTHSLSVTGTTDNPGNHTHTNTLSDPGHSHTYLASIGGGQLSDQRPGGVPTTNSTGASATGITLTNAAAGAHTHAVTSTGTSGSNGGTEARPTTLVVLTCVKT